MVAAAVIGGVATLASGAIGASAAGSAADSAAQSAAASNALQSQIYAKNTANAQPFIGRGNAAGDQINAMLGLGGSAPVTTPGTPATQDWMGYFNSQPDLVNAWNTNQAGYQSRFSSPAEFAQWQYQNFGKNEGRAPVPMTGGTAATTTGGQSPTDAQNAAFDNFKNSTGYQFAFDQGQNAANNNFAMRGALDSGAAVKAQTQYGQQTALNNAFLPYMNLLGTQQQAGLGASNALAGVGTAYGNQVASNNNNAAQAAGNAAIASGNAWSGALGGISNQIQNFSQSSYGGSHYSGNGQPSAAFNNAFSGDWLGNG